MSDRPAIILRREVAQLNWNQVLGHVFSDLAWSIDIAIAKLGRASANQPYITLENLSVYFNPSHRIPESSLS